MHRPGRRDSLADFAIRADAGHKVRMSACIAVGFAHLGLRAGATPPWPPRGRLCGSLLLLRYVQVGGRLLLRALLARVVGDCGHTDDSYSSTSHHVVTPFEAECLRLLPARR